VNAICGAGVAALVLFGIATLLHFAIAKQDARKRIQGQPVRWWVSLMFLVGAVFGAFLADNKRYYLHEVVGGMGGFGLLVGLVAGNIHGALNLFRFRDEKNGPVVLPHDSAETMAEQSQNPYAPPRRT
jgi:4-amino-4-deoxy-L-arabinose transferase-like glycosyltransferase